MSYIVVGIGNHLLRKRPTRELALFRRLFAVTTVTPRCAYRSGMKKGLEYAQCCATKITRQGELDSITSSCHGIKFCVEPRPAAITSSSRTRAAGHRNLSPQTPASSRACSQVRARIQHLVQHTQHKARPHPRRTGTRPATHPRICQD